MRQSDIIQSVKKKWHHVVFVCLSALSFSFLLFPKGIWLYNDLGWWPKNDAENLVIFKQILFSWDNFSSSYYGFDRFLLSFEKIMTSPFSVFLNHFLGSHIAQTAFYLVPLSIAYIYSLKLLKLLTLANSRIAALFFCFNPVSIYLVSQGTIFLTYCSIPVYFYSLMRLSRRIEIRYILLNILSLAVLIGYLRIVGVLIIFTFGIFLAFFDEVLKTIRNWGHKIIYLFIIYSLSFSGILTALIFVYVDHINSQANFISHQISLYADFFYRDYHFGNFMEFISFNQLQANFGRNFIFWNELFTVILLALIVYYIFIESQRIERVQFAFFSILIVILGLLFSGFVLSFESFIFIYTKIFPFLSSNLLWLRILELMCIVILIASIREKLLNVFVFTFVLLSVMPLSLSFTDIKLQKTETSIPFFKNKVSNFPALFYPSNLDVHNSLVLFDFPYPINPTYNSSYHYLFSNNPRLADDNQIALSALSNDPSKLWLFGLKDVFVFNNIPVFEGGQYDYYEAHDYTNAAVTYKDHFLKKLIVVEDNQTFTHFRLPAAADYDFNVYTPKSIHFATSTEFLPEAEVASRPIIFLDSQLSRLDSGTFSYLMASLNQQAKLQIKYSYINPTRYYLKVSNINLMLPLMIQFNQTFNPRWKIFVVDHRVSDSKYCNDSISDFPITQNASCEYKFSAKDYFYLSFLDSDIKNTHAVHLSGNIIGNTFMIGSDVLTEYADTDGTIYLMIYFQKQDYYVILLGVFVLIIGALSSIAGFQKLESLRADKESI